MKPQGQTNHQSWRGKRRELKMKTGLAHPGRSLEWIDDHLCFSDTRTPVPNIEKIPRPGKMENTQEKVIQLPIPHARTAQKIAVPALAKTKRRFGLGSYSPARRPKRRERPQLFNWM